MEQYFEIISSVPLFDGISRENLHSLMHCLQARTVTVRKGDPVFLEGDPAGVVGIVLATGLYMLVNNCVGSVSAPAVNWQAILIGALLVGVKIGWPYLTQKKLSPILFITVSAVLGAVVYSIPM